MLNKVCMFSLFVLNMKFDQINGPIEPYLRSVIISLMFIKSSTRIQSKSTVKKVLSSVRGAKLAALLLNEITQFLECNVCYNLIYKYILLNLL